ncbi:short chain dehydrogenase [Bordetella genomosp. 11]|uniref:Short chain dehydrogenase n=1 Tax=Bordetella genomosp. 11 TaxID=1416808 RepID=A0A261UZ62_9BORD|nr:short chain dehydrogenase [Bordetella genomosp. 11]OZI66570.1 short chain dehydrogenase [Bordetella genomosp. 11]
MRILLVGATGFLGTAIARELRDDHELVLASRSDATHPVDIQDDASVRALFEKAGQVDAIVSATGHVHFGPLARMTAEQFDIGLQGKLLGQVRLALIGQHYLRPGGSITLTTGILTEAVIRDGVNATAVNAGIEGFVRAAAFELRDARINAVSPTLLRESRDAYGASFPGFEPVPASRAALAFRRSIEGIETGQVYRVW